MEQLESLIGTLTYKRAMYELRLKKEPNNAYIDGIMNGISISINEIYKLIEQNGKD